jgi:hypothetical protein
MIVAVNVANQSVVDEQAEEMRTVGLPGIPGHEGVTGRVTKAADEKQKEEDREDDRREAAGEQVLALDGLRFPRIERQARSVEEAVEDAGSQFIAHRSESLVQVRREVTEKLGAASFEIEVQRAEVVGRIGPDGVVEDGQHSSVSNTTDVKAGVGLQTSQEKIYGAMLDQVQWLLTKPELVSDPEMKKMLERIEAGLKEVLREREELFAYGKLPFRGSKSGGANQVELSSWEAEQRLAA